MGTIQRGPYSSQRNTMPAVAVLLATYNGMEWIEAQVSSILGQVDVEVKLFVSDDQSTDGTQDWLVSLASSDDRVVVLPQHGGARDAGKNFYRLLIDADIEEYPFVALADQDDVWLLNKLAMQIELASQYAADGISSNVVACWPDGARALIDKAQPLRKLDFLFESAGPGCSFLMTASLVQRIRAVLHGNREAQSVKLHDWLIYTICRSSGLHWHINARPTLKYRQHEKNVVGVNLGPAAWCRRLGRIWDGWYRDEVCKLARVAKSLTQDAYLIKACDTILGEHFLDRIRLFRYIRNSRRALSERVFLGLLIAFRVF